MQTMKSQRLRGTREAKGLSLRDLERATGIHRGTLSRIEAGELRPSVQHLLALGRALDIHDLVEVLERFQP